MHKAARSACVAIQPILERDGRADDPITEFDAGDPIGREHVFLDVSELRSEHPGPAGLQPVEIEDQFAEDGVERVGANAHGFIRPARPAPFMWAEALQKHLGQDGLVGVEVAPVSDGRRPVRQLLEGGRPEFGRRGVPQGGDGSLKDLEGGVEAAARLIEPLLQFGDARLQRLQCSSHFLVPRVISDTTKGVRPVDSSNVARTGGASLMGEGP